MIAGSVSAAGVGASSRRITASWRVASSWGISASWWSSARWRTSARWSSSTGRSASKPSGYCADNGGCCVLYPVPASFGCIYDWLDNIFLKPVSCCLESFFRFIPEGFKKFSTWVIIIQRIIQHIQIPVPGERLLFCTAFRIFCCKGAVFRAVVSCPQILESCLYLNGCLRKLSLNCIIFWRPQWIEHFPL